MKKISSLIVMVISVLSMPVAVLASPPPIPLLVYGDVTIDSSQAPPGTAITVENNGAEVFSTTVNNEGKYFTEIPAENAGDILTYKVNGTVAKQVGTLEAVEQHLEKALLCQPRQILKRRQKHLKLKV